ncbi:DEKNAAC103616 [Brettanomyces naardenensis]|uniref:DEKNAAC103617 n=1 Tax=Brettanomyces naardenensis TaxID=13370 RepID=A0A448YP32_BRENA|nr:DEKNAAC103616 [Brettanomyces naardenensis]
MGTGKSTFINTLCDEDVIPVNRAPPKDGMVIENNSATIFEGGTKINLDIVLASGFGDSIDNTDSTAKLVEYLEAQFEVALKEECKIQRSASFKDTRVHAALYFIRPTGKGLRPLDIQCLKAIGERCNVIPIISKGDLLTEEERALNKQLIMKNIRDSNIQVYDFSTCFEDIEEELPGLGAKNMVPFSIVSGTERKLIDNVEYKVRKLPHGIVKVDDPSHSDFLLLRTCLLGACLQDLKDTTHEIFYERYRTEKLSEARRDTEKASEPKPRSNGKPISAKRVRYKKRKINGKNQDLATRLMSPQPFTLERMLAILHAICDEFDQREEISNDVGLMNEIATLTSLKTLVKLSGNDTIGGGSKWRSNVEWTVVKKFAGDVGFRIENYLSY